MSLTHHITYCVVRWFIFCNQPNRCSIVCEFEQLKRPILEYVSSWEEKIQQNGEEGWILAQAFLCWTFLLWLHRFSTGTFAHNLLKSSTSASVSTGCHDGGKNLTIMSGLDWIHVCNLDYMLAKSLQSVHRAAEQRKRSLILTLYVVIPQGETV